MARHRPESPPFPPAVIASPQVRMLSCSDFRPIPEFDTGADHGPQLLAEFAGRACYQSFDKPVPATATNAGFLAHILQVGHLQVLEHPQASFYLTGISQSAAHELLRHRHLSISQLSPRFDPAGLAGAGPDAPEPDALGPDTPAPSAPGPDAAGPDAPAPSAPLGSMVEPAVIAADEQLHQLFTEAVSASLSAHRELLGALEDRLPDSRLARSAARQAAAAVLPRAVETRLVVSGNFRAWRHVIAMRATEYADADLRELALMILEQLQQAAPNAFGDFVVSDLSDGTRTAHSPLVTEG